MGWNAKSYAHLGNTEESKGQHETHKVFGNGMMESMMESMKHGKVMNTDVLMVARMSV